MLGHRLGFEESTGPAPLCRAFHRRRINESGNIRLARSRRWCGGRSGTRRLRVLVQQCQLSSSAGSSGAACGNYNIAYMGALTGDAGALGQHMAGGIKLALDEYNESHADCQVGLKTFDSQGSPDQAPGLATQIVNDDSIIGLVGPGFSGESLATGKTFFDAGLPVISPSATNVTITQQGWTNWHRVIGNDAAQGAADAKFLTTDLGFKAVYVVDDAQDYSKGLADVVKYAPRRCRGRLRRDPGQADRHVGRRDQDPGCQRRRRLLRRLLHRGRSAPEAAAAGGLAGPVHVR